MNRIILGIIVFCFSYAANTAEANKFTYNKLNSTKSSVELNLDLESTIDIGAYKKLQEIATIILLIQVCHSYLPIHLFINLTLKKIIQLN